MSTLFRPTPIIRPLLATLLCVIGVAGCGSATHSQQRFELLRGSGKAPTSKMAAQMKSVGLGEDDQLIRVHRAETPNGGLWFASVGPKMCLFAGQPLAVSCSPRSEVEENGLVLGLVENPSSPAGPKSNRRYVIYGVLPDPRKTVRVKVGTREMQVVHVHDNAFSVRSSKPVFEL